MIEECLKLQAEYDQMVFQAHGLEGYEDILDTDLHAALLDECGELNHELKAQWCWWKKTQKPVDQNAVLMEFADVMHFVLMQVLWNESVGGDHSDNFLEDFEFLCKRGPIGAPVVSQALSWISDPTASSKELAAALYYLMQTLAISVKQACAVYKNKNKINRIRVREGY